MVHIDSYCSGDCVIMEEIIEEIHEEVMKTINSLYDQRKRDEGLISVRNISLDSLSFLLAQWKAEEIVSLQNVRRLQLKPK